MGVVVLILILVNIPVFKQISKWFFPSKEGLREAVRYTLTPDIVSAFKGKYMKDQIAQFKLGLMFVVYVVLIYVEYAIVKIIFFS